MCYPKPGPRCSAHAFKSLKKSRLAMLTQRSLVRRSPRPSSDLMDDYTKAMSAYESARWDFYKTPGGQQYIDKMLLMGTNEDGGILKEIDQVQLEESKIRAWTERVEDLNTLKTVLESSTESEAALHEGVTYLDGKEALLEESDVRHGWSNSADQVTSGHEYYSHQAIAWAQSLSAQERKDVLYWTDEGHYDVTKYLNTGILPPSPGEEEPAPDRMWQDLSDQQRMENYVLRMNTLLKRGSLSEKPIVVYRGVDSKGVLPPNLLEKVNSTRVRKTNKDKETLDEIEDYVTKKFTPGTVVTVPSFQSTSLNPEVASRFANNSNVIFEIKTRKANPVGSFSVQDDEEAEMLLPAAAKMKVIGVQKKVTYSSVNRMLGSKAVPVAKQFTVVQLEEID